jgi:hypothetical protein
LNQDGPTQSCKIAIDLQVLQGEVAVDRGHIRTRPLLSLLTELPEMLMRIDHFG